MRVPHLSLLLVLCLAATAMSGGEPDSRAAIRATVVDADSRMPVNGIRIILDDGSGVTTDNEGGFMITHPLPAGSTIELRHDAYHTVRLTGLVVPNGYTSHLTLAMTPRLKDAPVTVRFDGAINRALPAIATLQQDSVVADTAAPELSIADGFRAEPGSIPAAGLGPEATITKPYQNVDQLLELVPGVQIPYEGEVYIRGNPAGEVSYIADDTPVVGIQIEQVKGEKELELWHLQQKYNEIVRLCAQLLGGEFADRYGWSIEQLMQAGRDRVAAMK